MLIQHLKELQADGVVQRIDYQTIPPKGEYSLTKFGMSLANSLAPLCEWGTTHMCQVEKIMLGRQSMSASAE